MPLEDLNMTGDLFPISRDARFSVDRILDEFVSTFQHTREHIFFSPHWGPSN